MRERYGEKSQGSEKSRALLKRDRPKTVFGLNFEVWRRAELLTLYCEGVPLSLLFNQVLFLSG